MSLSRHLSDKCLMECMEEIQDLCGSANAVRSKNLIRARQPLSDMKIISKEGKFSYLAFMPDIVAIIKSECNVKQLTVISEEHTFIV